MPKEIVGIGAANVDIMGESAARLVMEDSNPGTLSVSVGGVTRNVCENTARLGLPTRLITTVGEDMYGEKIAPGAGNAASPPIALSPCPGKTARPMFPSTAAMAKWPSPSAICAFCRS